MLSWPCSPKRPNPTPYFLIHGTTCFSSIWSLGVTVEVENWDGYYVIKVLTSAVRVRLHVRSFICIVIIFLLTQLLYFTSIYIILYTDIVTSTKQEKFLPVFVSNPVLRWQGEDSVEEQKSHWHGLSGKQNNMNGCFNKTAICVSSSSYGRDCQQMWLHVMLPFHHERT